MSVAPSTTNFDGQSITETVSQTSNSCPAAVPNACVGTSTFVIGNSYQPSVCSAWSGATCTHNNVGPLLVGTQDLFYDQHADVVSQSFLSSGSCTQASSQQYYCGDTTDPKSYIRVHGSEVHHEWTGCQSCYP